MLVKSSSTSGPMRYLVANEVEWGEAHRYRVSVGPLFGKFVGFVMTKDNILHLNFLYHDFMWCMLDIENYSGY
jgi:hypothetical protein